MAFRPKENNNRPSIGYRLSSDRQPGVEIANNRMPQQRMGPRPFPPERGYPGPMPNPMEPFGPPPGMGPFRPERFPPMMPKERQGIEELMPYREEAAVDPSDYRTIIKMIEQGLNPEDYMASSGIMNALPQETQMAELSKPQLDFIKSPMGKPDFYSNYQDYKDAVDAREKKGFLGGIFGGGQEPATDPEIINKLKETYGTLPFQVPGIV